MKYIQLFSFCLLVYIVLKLSPKAEKKIASHTTKSPLVIDSCGLIDGRIADLVRSGLLDYQLIIPKFVIAELQLLADGNDSQKRARARFGLDIVAELQKIDPTLIVNTSEPSSKLTDDSLLDLYTIDFNLNKVAAIAGLKVINVNEIAQLLRPPILPGEKANIKIIQKGSTATQGVGYLEDGTMVVVENARSMIDKLAEIEIVRSFQTQAGRMHFATLVGVKPESSRPRVKPTLRVEKPTANQLRHKKPTEQRELYTPQPF
jgi:uncharacterized protein YacL